MKKFVYDNPDSVTILDNKDILTEKDKNGKSISTDLVVTSVHKDRLALVLVNFSIFGHFRLSESERYNDIFRIICGSI